MAFCPFQVVTLQHAVTWCLCLPRQTWQVGSLSCLLGLAVEDRKGFFTASGDREQQHVFMTRRVGDLDCDDLRHQE